MTREEQRYCEECRKVLDKEQLHAVTMAMDYGLPLEGIRKVVQSNKDAECMKELVFALMEGTGTEVMDYLCENEFNQYQIKEAVEGIRSGLSFEQIKTYAVSGMTASKMKNMRSQLTENMEKAREAKEDKTGEYMKNLMEIMDRSIRQFQESNERFESLSALVKEHVVDEKNREIQDLYENLKYKDAKIQELQKKVEEKEKSIARLKAAQQPESPKEEQPVSDEELQKALFSETRITLPEPAVQEKTGSLKKRMLAWVLRSRDIPKDMVEKLIKADLNTEQLEEVRLCMESGLDDQEISRVIKNSPPPERMKKMREILLLMKQRKAGA